MSRCIAIAAILIASPALAGPNRPLKPSQRQLTFTDRSGIFFNISLTT